jgi:putative ABC transport system permease protein
MNIITIIISSLKRQKGKKIFLLASMVLGFTTIMSLYYYVDSQKQEIESQFDEYGANIVITPKSDSLSLTYGGVNLSGIVTAIEEIDRDEVSKIWTIQNKKNLRAVSPKLIGVESVSVRGNEETVLLVGVDLVEESKIKAWWQVDGRYPAIEGEVLAGIEAARKLELFVGDLVYIHDTQMRVTGILNATGSQDDSALIAPLADMERIFDKKGKISIVEVSALCSDCPIDEMVAQISGVMPNAQVRAIRQVMDQRMIIVGKIERLVFTISGILICLCGLLIFTTVSGSITERKKEIGIFRAIGFSSGFIMRIVLGEYLFLGIGAGLAGIFATTLFAFFALPGLSGVTGVRFDAGVLGIGFLALIALGISASFLPARRAANIDPVQSINSF